MKTNEVITIDYKGAGMNFTAAVAAAFGVTADYVRVAVSPAASLIPFCCWWRIVESCADAVVYIKGKQYLLNII